MVLNEFGQVAQNEWKKTEQVRKNVIIDSYIIMPNHIHIILILLDNKGVGASRRFAPTEPLINRGIAPPVMAGSVGAIMAQFKSIVTKRINAIRETPRAPVWQRNYYEHVIRDQADLTRMRQYIADNPGCWLEDENHPSNWN